MALPNITVRELIAVLQTANPDFNVWVTIKDGEYLGIVNIESDDRDSALELQIFYEPDAA